jgi:hypothetical protein
MSTLKVEELTGSGNFIVPPGVYYLEWVEGVGGSGGGGRGIGLGLGGQGAPGAAAARLNRFAVVPGQSIPYSVGVKGNGSAATGNSTSGGDTSFGSTLLLAKGSVGGAPTSNAVATPPSAADCIGDVKIGGNVGIANSGGNGGYGGPGPTLPGGNFAIVAGAGGLSGQANNLAGNGNSGGPGQPDGAGGGGGRNLTPLTGGDGVVGRLYVAYFLPEVWS